MIRWLGWLVAGLVVAGLAVLLVVGIVEARRHLCDAGACNAPAPVIVQHPAPRPARRLNGRL